MKFTEDHEASEEQILKATKIMDVPSVETMQGHLGLEDLGQRVRVVQLCTRRSMFITLVCTITSNCKRFKLDDLA